MSWVKQALTGPDNRTYEGAYLALAFMVVLAGFAVFCMLGLAALDLLVNKKDFNPAGLGGGISAVLGGLAAFLGGVGAYILMDRKQPTAPLTTTTESQSTVVKTIVPAPVVVPDVTPTAQAMSGTFTATRDAGRGIEALSPSAIKRDVAKLKRKGKR